MRPEREVRLYRGLESRVVRVESIGLGFMASKKRVQPRGRDIVKGIVVFCKYLGRIEGVTKPPNWRNLPLLLGLPKAGGPLCCGARSSPRRLDLQKDKGHPDHNREDQERRQLGGLDQEQVKDP